MRTRVRYNPAFDKYFVDYKTERWFDSWYLAQCFATEDEAKLFAEKLSGQDSRIVAEYGA